MAYVSAFGRPCNAPGCDRSAELVVKNRFNAECNYFCRRHRAEAERLAARITEMEKGEAKLV